MYKAVYRYLLSTYGRRPGYWVGFTATLIQTLIMRVVVILLVARLTTQLVKGEPAAARQTVLWYLGVAVISMILRFVRDTFGNMAENSVYAGLMVTYYDKLVSKDMSFYRDHQTGYLAGTFRQHVDSIMSLARLLRGDVLQSAISLTIPMTVLLLAWWPIGLVVLVVMVAQITYISWTSHITARYRAISHEVYRHISGQVSDDITNIVAFKASGDAIQSRQRMKELAHQEFMAFGKRRQLLAIFDTPRDFVTMMGTGTLLWIIAAGSHSVSQSVGLVVLAVTYMFQIYQTVQNLPSLVEQHDDLVSKLYPTLEYLGDSYEAIRDVARPEPTRGRHGAIELQQVRFGYLTTSGRRIPVFNGLTLSIASGEQVGVVGLSGAGKSTLASLLMRFDDIDDGSITIDGVDIRQMAQAELRQHIAFVPQEPLLFHRSIRENITYFKRDATTTNIERAAKAAHAHEFISSLPEGYETLVGERGVKLSGGQKQRVVLARSILKDAPIMIFDEATSALDSESEKIIQASMPTIMGKRTALVIAHRLSTVAGLDRIIVMEQGRVAESGTHTELLAQRGRYYSLWQKQSRLEESKS